VTTGWGWVGCRGFKSWPLGHLEVTFDPGLQKNNKNISSQQIKRLCESVLLDATTKKTKQLSFTWF